MPSPVTPPAASGCSRGSRVVNLVFPTALPYLMTGLRLAAAVALILAITAEMVIGNPGLGREIVFAQSRRRLAGGVRPRHRRPGCSACSSISCSARSSAGRSRGTSRCEGRRCCDPLHEHRRRPLAAAARVWAEASARAPSTRSVCPSCSLVHLGHLVARSRPRSSSPRRSSSSRRSSRPGSARPSSTMCCRASVAWRSASSLSIAIGIAAGTLIGLIPLAARPARADARVLPRRPAARAHSDRRSLLMGIDRCHEGRRHRRRVRCGRSC